jgi:hypothetical protein
MVVRTVAFVIVRRVLGLVGLGSAPDVKDIEIAVLRHQLMVVRRQVARPCYAPADRMVLAVLARLLPRERWHVSSLRPRRCCGGIGSWWRAAGPTRPLGEVGRSWILRSSTWWFGWLRRIRGWGM